MDYLSELVSILVTIGIYRLLLWVMEYEVTKKNKYKFQCTMCDFRVTSNDRQVVTMDRVAHRHSMIQSKQ